MSLQYHLVWYPKYRRPVLVSPVDSRLKALLSEKAQELELVVHLLELMPEHVPVLLEGPPTLGVNRLKDYTSRALREAFAFLGSRLPTLWSCSYYAGSVGSVSESAVRKYIESQKGK